MRKFGQILGLNTDRAACARTRANGSPLGQAAAFLAISSFSAPPMAELRATLGWRQILFN